MKRFTLMALVVSTIVSAVLCGLGDPITAQGGTRPSKSKKSARFYGETVLTSPTTDKSVSAEYQYVVDTESGQGDLTIVPKEKQSAFSPYHYAPPVGQEFLTAVYPSLFGDLGTFICAVWDSGAVSQKLSVYRLGPSGRIDTVFEGACRFGFQVLDVTGDGRPDICGCDGDVGPSKKTLSIYTWNGKRFQLAKTLSVTTPHSYNVRSDSKEN